jgi:large subunit ribosomal protein L25
MSTEDFKISAKVRDVAGKGASRRLRREEGVVPGIVYGANKKPQQISLEYKELIKHLEHEAFYSHIIELDVEGKSEDVILKDLQRHPAKAIIYHVDFMRVSKTKKLRAKVPLHFVNEATSIGVKQQGGVVTHNITELEISCLPANLPEYIEVDLAEVEVGSNIHISDLVLPKGVESVDLSHGSDHDLTVATIVMPRGSIEADEESAEEGGEESGDE